MINKKVVAHIELILMITSVFAFSFMMYDGTEIVSAQSTASTPSFCCEKTNDGAWCVNTDESECSGDYSRSPTSCEATSYCKLGTCYDSSEGVCMGNTPKNVCDSQEGIWDSREVSEVPQCQLGCCIIADQAAFVPLVRCKRLSTLFGVSNDYRTNIGSELECIATAQAQDMGACVFETDFERVCEFTTRGDCGAREEVEVLSDDGGIGLSGEKKFYKDMLCSADELGTSCARQISTTCYNGEIYFEDDCGNRENVYSSDKDRSHNRGRVADPDEICSPNDGSNTNCGNCDYLLGTRCGLDKGLFGGGDLICKKVECVDRDGNKRLNGESWCVYDGAVGNSLDTVGSRHYREVCVDGEVRVEPCADFRNEVCIGDSVDTSAGDFGNSGCRVNRWQDCVSQDNEEDCINNARRDCNWLPSIKGLLLGGGESGQATGFSNPTVGGSFTEGTPGFSNPTATGSVVAPITGKALFGSDDDGGDEESTTTNRPKGVCVPNISPGLNFWKEGTAGPICGQASAKCIVTYEKGLLDSSWKIKDGEECLEESWAIGANRICTALGDCGGYVNYQGDYTDDGFEWKIDGERQELSPNTVNIVKGGFPGYAIATLTGRAIFDLVSGQKDSLAEVTEIETDVGTDTAPLADADTGNPSPVPTSNSMATDFIIEKLGIGISETGFPSALVTGAQWALIAYVGGQFLGGILGFDDNNTDALSTALAAGFGTYQFLSTWDVTSAFTTANPLIGLGVGAVVFLMMYKKTKVDVVTFDCMAWQAPVGGGSNCEICNDDALPCSEYRCFSLGQNCEIVNAGTDQETCVDVNPNDVNPPLIRPNELGLTVGHRYTNVKNSPPGPGFKIEQDSAECLKAFTPLQFGIITDEPAQCKVDFENTGSFDEMTTYFGKTNLFLYNHTENLVLPNAEALRNSSLVLENGKELNLFIRCQDKSGNSNEAEYAVRLCVDPSPDTTPPKIEATSIIENACVAEGVSSSEVEFYTNEPAECKWSHFDQDYDQMPNGMSCANEFYQFNAAQLFTCRATLEGITRDGTEYYIRCKDGKGKEEADRNPMRESFKFSLRGSTGLRMTSLKPDETIFGGVSPLPVELYVETLFGCNNGRAICEYSDSGIDGNYIQFFDTNTDDGIHTQRQDLADGDYEYFIRCIDAGGNIAVNSTEFTVEVDETPPSIARIYHENSFLKIITVRKSECSYTFNNCDFSFEEGTLMASSSSEKIHLVDWSKEHTYYIKCRDEFKNEDAECSTIVKPTDNFL